LSRRHRRSAVVELRVPRRHGTVGVEVTDYTEGGEGTRVDLVDTDTLGGTLASVTVDEALILAADLVAAYLRVRLERGLTGCHSRSGT